MQSLDLTGRRAAPIDFRGRADPLVLQGKRTTPLAFTGRAMKPSTHQPQTVQAGDDWQITGTLLDDASKPINLAGATIEWGLLDVERTMVIRPADVTVTIAGPGKCSISVPAAVTNLTPGRYTDALRLTAGGVRATMWVGPITVNASLLPA